MKKPPEGGFGISWRPEAEPDEWQRTKNFSTLFESSSTYGVIEMKEGDAPVETLAGLNGVKIPVLLSIEYIDILLSPPFAR